MLLAYANQCRALSGGLFEVASGVLRRVWDFARQPPASPSRAALDELLEHIRRDHVG